MWGEVGNVGSEYDDETEIGTVNRVGLVTMNKEQRLQEGNLVCHAQHVS
jgi:hypothetical protein